jgi:predicted TIM-barrel fold metal-dependent hydrolase
MTRMLMVFAFLAGSVVAAAEAVPPVIDVHMHALPYDHQGPPPLAMCTPMTMPVWDQQAPYAETFFGLFKNPVCDDPVWSPMSDEENLARNLAVIEKHNVYGVLAGTRDRVDSWVAAAPGRFFPGLTFNAQEGSPSPEQIVEQHENGVLDVLMEITTQYAGIEPADPQLEPYWAALEANNIPAGIHVGTGPPGVIYLGLPGYRGRMHSALTMEDVLVAHPGLRVYLGHAGFPMRDDLLALMYAHPQIYVGIGVIVYTQRREAFYPYLKAIFDAGFGKRVMFGSDQMVWPETIERGIQVINDAPFLSDEQKRDVLFWNAARFLRLPDEEIARMHAAGK